MADESGNGSHSPSLFVWLRRNGWNVGVAVTVLLALAGGLRFLGQLEERVNAAHESVGRIEYRLTALDQTLDTKFAAIDEQLRSQVAEVRAARDEAVDEIRASLQAQDDPVIFFNGRLTSGLDMGIDSSAGLTTWAGIENGSLCMAYPAGQTWGAVFITVGKPTQPPRPGRDFSSYKHLLIEAKGKTGDELVLIGMKDNTDRDDGSEAKVRLGDLTQDWQSFEMSLAHFRTAELTRLYVVVEFVFEGEAASELCVRRIEFQP